MSDVMNTVGAALMGIGGAAIALGVVCLGYAPTSRLLMSTELHWAFKILIATVSGSMGITAVCAAAGAVVLGFAWHK